MQSKTKGHVPGNHQAGPTHNKVAMATRRNMSTVLAVRGLNHDGTSGKPRIATSSNTQENFDTEKTTQCISTPHTGRCNAGLATAMPVHSFWLRCIQNTPFRTMRCKMRLSFLLATPNTLTPTLSSLLVSLTVLRVGKPGGPPFPTMVPEVSTGRKPCSCLDKGGGGACRVQRLLQTIEVRPDARVEVQNSVSVEFSATRREERASNVLPQDTVNTGKRNSNYTCA